MKTKVIYIVGEGRSGSTLLERMLGQHPEIFAAGELKLIWERSFLEDQLCSCNYPFSKCPIWTNIIKYFLKFQKNINPNEIIYAINKTSRIRHYLLNKDLNNKYARYLNEIYYNLYTAIKDTTNKQFIVDASKHPVFAHILANNNKLDIYFIHLTRDPRGVAYSWKKNKKRPEITSKVAYMPKYPIIRSAISWNIVNKISLDLKKHHNIKYFHLKYEDLVRTPKDSLKKLYSFLGIKNHNYPFFIKDNQVLLNQNHTVAGNPFRFKTGNIKLLLDNEWNIELNKISKTVITLINRNLLYSLEYT